MSVQIHSCKIDAWVVSDTVNNIMLSYIIQNLHFHIKKMFTLVFVLTVILDIHKRNPWSSIACTYM